MITARPIRFGGARTYAVLRRSRPAEWGETLDDIMCSISEMPIITLVVPSGRIGPRHPLRPAHLDPYFTAWIGDVAYDEAQQVLYYETDDRFEGDSFTA